jgi:GNAT superfamily N-acetyltransferase
MTHVTIRPALATDLARCLTLDPSFVTDRVWQMDTRAPAGQIAVTFRTVRLPREMRVAYPREARMLAAGWQAYAAILIADQPHGLAGYAALTASPQAPQAAVWVNDLVVAKAVRRTGVGSGLLKAAADWGRAQQLKWLVVEVQTKNYPAISFCQKQGLKFCGFNDRYFANQDIALFFALALH